VYEGIRRANADHFVRLQNPVLLLEHGQQIGNVYLASLMFVMGLDALFMAGESAKFMQRVGGFLGVNNLIFLADSLMKRQPKTSVSEVLQDLYELRNTIAHGQEIPKQPYREKHDLMSTAGYRINQIDFSYADLMQEASLFLLTTTLRRIFTEGLYDAVADVKQWRQRLTIYEHRYQNAGGPALVKARGR
jgi:hypothetical protein